MAKSELDILPVKSDGKHRRKNAVVDSEPHSDEIKASGTKSDASSDGPEIAEPTKNNINEVC